VIAEGRVIFGVAARRGEDQARALAREISADAERGQRIAAVYSSPLPAAVATATTITEELGMPQPGIFSELLTLTPAAQPEFKSTSPGVSLDLADGPVSP
jgi:broad specificity phosphatase PhoE